MSDQNEIWYVDWIYSNNSSDYPLHVYVAYLQRIIGTKPKATTRNCVCGVFVFHFYLYEIVHE